MVDPVEKSTQVPALTPGRTRVAPKVLLDGRLGLFHEERRWLAVADLHFGYEVGRRQAGGLWPMWGMQTVEARLRELVESLEPECLILLGDIVDGGAVPKEAIDWLKTVEQSCTRLVLIEGNHDRGEVKRHFEFLPSFEIDGFFFHHGHRDLAHARLSGPPFVEVTGHHHPSVCYRDGAGTSLRLPSLAMERAHGRERWVLPAFSPWAGGGAFIPTSLASEVRQWACSKRRVFEVLP